MEDMWTVAQYLFVAPAGYAEKDVDKFWKEENYTKVLEVCGKLVEAAPSGKEAVGEFLEGYIREREWPMGKVMNCLRLALAGSASGLGIADIVSLIGIPEAAARVERAAATLGA